MKKKKIVFLSVLGLMVISGSIWGYSVHQKQVQASSMFDSTFDAECRKGMKLPVSKSQIPAILTKKYDKPYPALTPTGIYSVDLDTYAASWDAVAGGDETLKNYKAKLPAIIATIRSMYGEPFQNHHVVVVMVPDFENDPDFNEWGDINIGGQYRSDLNLIMYDQSVINEPTSFIHEIVHSFNQGTILADSYEEGLVQSVAMKVAASLQLAPESTSFFPTANRPDLSSTMGFFRTNDDGRVSNDRYDAAATFFGGRYDAANNFYKTFRTHLKKSRYYSEILTNGSVKFVSERLIGASICADLMFKPHYNVLRPYVTDLQKVLSQSLPAAVTHNLSTSILGKTTDQQLHPFQNYLDNQIINIYPENKLYSDTAFHPVRDTLRIYSSYKRNDLLEIFFEYYRKSHPVDETKAVNINLGRIQQFGATIMTDNTGVLAEMTKLLESPPDKVKIDLTTPPSAATAGAPTKPPVYSYTFPTSKEVLTRKNDLDADVIDSIVEGSAQSSSNDELTSSITTTYSSADILTQAHLDANYSGQVEMTVTSTKKVWQVTPRRARAGSFWPASTIVWPDGFNATPRTETAVMIKLITFANGKITTVANSPKQTLATTTTPSRKSTGKYTETYNLSIKVGDANGDGKVDPLDSRIITNIVAGTISKPVKVCVLDVNRDGQISRQDTTSKGQSSGVCAAQKIGDVDGNNKIDSADADLISDMVAGLVTKPANICLVDVNQNGKIDQGDITAKSPGVCSKN